MNTHEISMVMEDNEVPVAVLPYEMLGIDSDSPPEGEQAEFKFSEINTLFQSQAMVFLPSRARGVDGVLAFNVAREFDQDMRELVAMFIEPFEGQLDKYGAMALAKLVAQ